MEPGTDSSDTKRQSDTVMELSIFETDDGLFVAEVPGVKGAQLLGVSPDAIGAFLQAIVKAASQKTQNALLAGRAVVEVNGRFEPTKEGEQA